MANQVFDPFGGNLTASAIARSKAFYCPANSKINLNFSATASVKIISNPFADNNTNAKDVVLSTVAASGEFVIAAASVIVLDCTANTGTVIARAVLNGGNF